MKSYRYPFLFLLVSLVFLGSACRGIISMNQEGNRLNVSQSTVDEVVPSQQAQASGSNASFWMVDLSRMDDQGAVSVEVVPLVPVESTGRLDFYVALNTHSVDLSMDLASLAVLSTDTGHTVQAVEWDAPRGGHHLRGILSFPTDEDDPLLEKVSSVSLTISDVDVPQRSFTWER